MWRVKFLAKCQNFNFWQFKKKNNFDFVLFWLGIWCESLVWVIMGQWGVSQNAAVLVALVVFASCTNCIVHKTEYVHINWSTVLHLCNALLPSVQTCLLEWPFYRQKCRKCLLMASYLLFMGFSFYDQILRPKIRMSVWWFGDLAFNFALRRLVTKHISTLCSTSPSGCLWHESV